MNVPLLDLKAQYATIKAEVDAAIAEVMESQHFILGPKVEQCEKAIAGYSGCAHAVGVSSGTDALLACLMAEDIGPGDEVITTPYTFFATAGAIARVGRDAGLRRHRSGDLQPRRRADRGEGHRPDARHHPGPSLRPDGRHGRGDARSPKQHGLVVIEDAAQAIGAEYKGRRAGSIGHYGCFSFFPSKNLGAAGDGGMVVTNDPQRAREADGACARTARSRSTTTR